jgi:hypothetical protein
MTSDRAECGAKVPSFEVKPMALVCTPFHGVRIA